MNVRIYQWLDRIVQRDRKYARKFMAQYRNRTIIVHNGLSVEWLSELLSLGGGGAHFRVDLRHSNPQQRSPLDRIIHRHILALQLPLPLLLDVRPNRISVRHLQRFGTLCLPADIAWIVEDMRTRDRAHTHLDYVDGRFERTDGLPVGDNLYRLDDDTTI